MPKHQIIKNLMFSNGSLIDDRTGFAIHNNIDCRIEQRVKVPSSVFTAEILAIRTALSYILSNPRGRHIIFTDSLGFFDGTGLEEDILQYPSIYHLMQTNLL
jgi:hypothetical protein